MYASLHLIPSLLNSTTHRFGNLRKYLINHRNHFVNQIDPVSGTINFDIGPADLVAERFFPQVFHCMTTAMITSRERMCSQISETTVLVAERTSGSESLNSNSDVRDDYKGHKMTPISTKVTNCVPTGGDSCDYGRTCCAGPTR